MFITTDSPAATRTLVYLNNKLIRYWISAEDGPNGFVEIVDPAAMAPVSLDPVSIKVEELDSSNVNIDNPVAEVDESEFVELKTKKLNGQVEFKTLG